MKKNILKKIFLFSIITLFFSVNFSSANTCQDAGGQCKAESSCLGQIPEFNNVCQQENSDLVCCEHLIPQDDCVDNGGTCIDPNHQCLNKMEEYDYACSLNEVCCETPASDECFEIHGGTCTAKEDCITEASSLPAVTCPDSSKPICCAIPNDANMCFANEGSCTNIECEEYLSNFDDECTNGRCCKKLFDSCGESGGVCKLKSECENPINIEDSDTYCSFENGSFDYGCCKEEESNEGEDGGGGDADGNGDSDDNGKDSENTQTYSYEYTNPIAYGSITEFLGGLLDSSQTLISWLAVIFIVIGGILYITASGKESQITLAKKTIIYSLIGLALALAGPSLLKEIREIIIPEATGEYDFDSANSLVQILTNAMIFILTIVTILAMMSLVYSGFIYLTSAGSRENIDKAKKIGKFSALALVLSGSSIILIRLILEFLDI
jgi:hypothetical protein